MGDIAWNKPLNIDKTMYVIQQDARISYRMALHLIIYDVILVKYCYIVFVPYIIEYFMFYFHFLEIKIYRDCACAENIMNP